MRGIRWIGLIAILAFCAPAVAEQTISADTYLDKLRGMWLGQILGNYAGRPTEGDPNYRIPGGNPAGDIDWGFITTDPWSSDDDTCFEYMYMDLLKTNSAPTNEQLKQKWLDHVPYDSFYFANKQARYLMQDGYVPPDTGSINYNISSWAIDSQITTESLGAAAPGNRKTAGEN